MKQVTDTQILAQLNEMPASAGVAPRNVMRGLLQGITLGWGDELASGLAAVPAAFATGRPLGEVYRDIRDAERKQYSAFREQNPATSAALEVGGGLLSGGLGGARAGATNLGRALARAPLTTRAGVASLTGATAGGVAGAGEAPELADVPAYAARSAVPGAILGPIAEIGVTGVQAGARALSPQRSAERAMRKAIKRGDMTLGQVQAKLRKMGPGAVLADVNEGLLTQLDTLANTPGPTRTRAIRQLTKRSGEQMDEILNATGPGKYAEILDGVKDIRSRVGSRLYQRAFSRGVQHNDELEQIFTGIEEVMPGAWRGAKKYGQLDVLGKGGEALDLGDARPSLEGWQAIKEYLDDSIGALYRDGKEKKAGLVRSVRDRLLRELDDQNPMYNIARQVWAGAKQFENAMEDGLSFMRPGVTASALEKSLKGLSDVDRLAYREGARQAIQDTMERAGYTHDASKFFRSPSMTRKLRAVFGTRDAAKILRTIESSSAKQRTFSRATGNSLTALRQAAQAEEGLTQDAIGAVVDLATSSPGAAGTQTLRRIASKVPTSRESTRALIGQMLLEQDPARQRQIFEWLSSGRPLPPPAGAGLLAPAALGAGAGILAAQP